MTLPRVEGRKGSGVVDLNNPSRGQTVVPGVVGRGRRRIFVVAVRPNISHFGSKWEIETTVKCFQLFYLFIFLFLFRFLLGF